MARLSLGMVGELPLFYLTCPGLVPLPNSFQSGSFVELYETEYFSFRREENHSFITNRNRDKDYVLMT